MNLSLRRALGAVVFASFLTIDFLFLILNEKKLESLYGLFKQGARMEGQIKREYGKYIVFYQGYNGWADRFKGILATYQLALLSDREFILIMSRPCNITDFLLPNQVNWNRDLTRLIAEKKLRANFTSKQIFTTPVGYQNIVDCLIDIVFDMNETDVIMVKPYHEWTNLIGTIAKFQPKLEQLGFDLKTYDANHLQHVFFKRLFRFTPSFQHLFDEHAKQLRPSGDHSYLMCAQIRTGDQIAYKKNKSETIAKLYWNYMETKLAELNDKHEEIILFVTSDYVQTELMTADMFKQRAAKVVRVESDSSHFKDIKNCSINQNKFMLDFFLLSLCDFGVYGHGEYGKTGLLNRPYPKNLNAVQIKGTRV